MEEKVKIPKTLGEFLALLPDNSTRKVKAKMKDCDSNFTIKESLAYLKIAPLELLHELTTIFAEFTPQPKKHSGCIAALSVLCEIQYEETNLRMVEFPELSYVVYRLGNEKPFAAFSDVDTVYQFTKQTRNAPYKYFVFSQNTENWQALAEFNED